MGTRSLLVGLISFFTVHVYAQFEETQIKFQLPDSVAGSNLQSRLDGMNDFDFKSGETYRYYDIYLDTPEEILYKAGFSLRIRKRVKSDSIPTYTMQLKSEAQGNHDSRIEVEEKELDFYRILKANGDTVYVSQLLDSVFSSIDRHGEMSSSIELLESWLASSVDASITPFQYLYHHYPQVFQRQTLARLKAKMIGVSQRQRGFVYVSEDKFEGPKLLPRSKDDNPIFFQENKELVWLMETSLDSSVFYFTSSSKKALIREFEIELKYEENQWGTNALRTYQEALKKSMDLDVIRESKYKQALKQRGMN